MKKYSKKQNVSSETQEDSLKIAKATQRPGQTKEQTKLIAQGIQKGIEHYKKQQKEKSRELNKKLKKVSSQLNQRSELSALNENLIQRDIVYQQHALPWVLLVVSWVGFGYYAFV